MAHNGVANGELCWRDYMYLCQSLAGLLVAKDGSK